MATQRQRDKALGAIARLLRRGPRKGRDILRLQALIGGVILFVLLPMITVLIFGTSTACIIYLAVSALNWLWMAPVAFYLLVMFILDYRDFWRMNRIKPNNMKFDYLGIRHRKEVRRKIKSGEYTPADFPTHREDDEIEILDEYED